MGSERWLPWPAHPESQNAFLRSGPAQLLPLRPTALTTPCPLEKAFSWSRGPAPPPPPPPAMGSVLSLAIWWRRVGRLSGHSPLCAQPSLAAWYEAQLLPDPHPEGRGEALEGLGLGALNSSSLSVSHLSDAGRSSSGGLGPPAWGAGGLVREALLGTLWQPLCPLCSSARPACRGEAQGGDGGLEGPRCPHWGGLNCQAPHASALLMAAFLLSPQSGAVPSEAAEGGPRPPEGHLGSVCCSPYLCYCNGGGTQWAQGRDHPRG